MRKNRSRFQLMIKIVLCVCIDFFDYFAII